MKTHAKYSCAQSVTPMSKLKESSEEQNKGTGIAEETMLQRWWLVKLWQLKIMQALSKMAGTYGGWNACVKANSSIRFPWCFSYCKWCHRHIFCVRSPAISYLPGIL